MSIHIKIKRQKSSQEKPYYETFEYIGDLNITLASLLDELNSHEVLYNINGSVSERITWECSCQQKMCGACAMVICGVPSLACSVFLSEITKNENTILLEPLSKFPVIKDLMVDRSILFENMKNMSLWLENEAVIDKNKSREQYQASKCLMCGCCLEVCPNFVLGDNFYGAISMVAAFKIIEQSEYGDHKKEIKKKYKKYIYEGCGKSLACNKICPAGIPLEDLLVKTNAAAVWRK